MPESPKLALQTSFKQTLVITKSLLQALEILQMPQLDLAQWLREEIEKNPLLELETKPSKSHQEIRSIPSLPSLYDHLMNQIRETFPVIEEQEIAERIFEELDEKGFIAKPLEEISSSLQQPLRKIEAIVEQLQTFDPPGIFALNLQECLLLQLKAKGQGETTAYQIIHDHFQDFLRGKFKKIEELLFKKKKILRSSKGQDCDEIFAQKEIGETEFKLAFHSISHLNFRPAAIFHHERTPLAKADLYITKTDTTWTIETVEDEWPKFKFQKNYLSLNTSSKEEKESLRNWSQSARSIFRALKRRQQLLIEIGTFLVQKQKNFLDQTGELKPLKIHELAEYLGLHESTISRALAGKYAVTPRGFLPLHSLFCASPLAVTAKQTLQQLIDQEDKTNPMTDEQLMQQLSSIGIKLARRTVVKYRKQLKINTACRRKYSRLNSK